MKVFDINNLPQHGRLNLYMTEHAGDGEMPVRAVKIKGPFVVKTETEELECDNGYLVLDLDGYPYPMENSLFKKMYQRVGGCS